MRSDPDYEFARSPARIEAFQLDPITVVDAAHNEASAAALATTLKQHWPQHRVTFVLAATRGKDVRSILRKLIPVADCILFTKYLDNPRCFDPRKLASMAEAMGAELPGERPQILVEPHPIEAWQRAQALARQTANATQPALICVTGSFFLAAELRPSILAAEAAGENKRNSAKAVR